MCLKLINYHNSVQEKIFICLKNFTCTLKTSDFNGCLWQKKRPNDPKTVRPTIETSVTCPTTNTYTTYNTRYSKFLFLVQTKKTGALLWF